MNFNIKQILNKYVYRIIPVVVAFVIILSSFLCPVSAATKAIEPTPDPGDSTTLNVINPLTDFISTTSNDEYKIFVIRPYNSGYSTRIYENSLSLGYRSNIYNLKSNAKQDIQLGPRYTYNSAGQQVAGYTYDFDFTFFSNGNFIDISMLDDTCYIQLDFKINLTFQSGTFSYPQTGTFKIDYYDSSQRYLSSDVADGFTKNYDSYSGLAYLKNKPKNARYATVSVVVNDLEFYYAAFADVAFNLGNVTCYVGTIKDRPTTVNILDVNDGNTYVDNHMYYLVDNDDELGSVRLTSDVPGYLTYNGSKFNTITFPGVVGDSGNYNINWRMFQPNKYLQIEPIKSGSYAVVDFDFTVDTDYDFYFPNIQVAIYYYKKDFSVAGNQRNYVNRDYTFNGNSGSIASLFELEIPDDAEYMAISVIMQSFRLYGNSDTVPVTINVDKYYFGVEIEDYTYYYGQHLLDSVDRLNGAADGLQLDKPAIDKLTTSIDKLIDRNALLLFTGALSIFWQSPFLTSIVVSVFTLVMMSFVVFGKK